MASYREFLARKAAVAPMRGVESVPPLADHLFPFQRSCVDFLLRAGSGGLFLDTGLGKQQPASEPVLTPGGWRALGSLTVGDLVIGSNGYTTRVTGVYPQGVRPVYRIWLSDGTFARCGDEHLWAVRTKVDRYRGLPFRALSTAAIAASIHRDWQLPMVSPIDGFDGAQLPLDPYTLGVVLGDGCVSGPGISICTDNWIGSTIGWRKLRSHDSADEVGYWAPPLDSKLTCTLRSMGVFGARAWEKHVPEEYLRADVDARRSLLAGLLDTDGYAMPDGGAEFCSTSRALVDAVCSLVRSLGGVARGLRLAASTYSYKGDRLKGRDAWRVNVKLQAPHNPFRLPRKASQYVVPSKYPPTRIIRSVEAEGCEEEQVCIRVEAADHLYVTRDYILTHNTACELEWCRHAAAATNGRALILTPLAVARQIEREGKRWGYEIRVIREQSEAGDGINVCNYDRLEKLDTDAFGAVALDESSILKSFTGKTTRALISAFAEHRFRLSATATPAPNDHMELGQHAEFCGVMSSVEMLSRFFINDTSQASQHWRLKTHGVESFWDWMSSWCRMASMPSDLGDSDDGFVLPPLNVSSHRSAAVALKAEGGLFGDVVMSATEMHKVKRQTSDARAAVVAELIRAEPGEPWVAWCDTDYEADAILRALAGVPHVVEVRGSHPVERKESALAAFADGSARVIVTKPSVCGFGLNWQHCARTVFVGRSFSYESWYQAIRRFWRFGQTRPVECHVVVAAGEDSIGRVIDRKASDHDSMKSAMTAAMRRAVGADAAVRVAYNPTHEGRLPCWIG